VVKGEMSVIGPRPQDQRCFDVFRKEDKAEILKVRPGLSGIGAIYVRDEENLLYKAQGDMIRFYDTVISPYKGQLDCIGIFFSERRSRPPASPCVSHGGQAFYKIAKQFYNLRHGG